MNHYFNHRENTQVLSADFVHGRSWRRTLEVVPLSSYQRLPSLVLVAGPLQALRSAAKNVLSYRVELDSPLLLKHRETGEGPRDTPMD